MLKAVEVIRRARGGSQAHVMRANDGQLFLLKLIDNPQGTRILANELLACRVARKVGLPVPEPVVIELDETTIRNQNIGFELACRTYPARAGLQFGSRMVVDDLLFDFLPETLFSRVQDLCTFYGALVLDKWLCNTDGRQVIFHKSKRSRKYHLQFIDWGYIANALEWSFPDSPLRGTYARNGVYANICGWDDFEPWLSRVEHFSPADLFAAAEDIPSEWYGGAREDLERLLERLLDRRRIVRDLIDSFRLSSRNPCPNWGLARLAAAA